MTKKTRATMIYKGTYDMLKQMPYSASAAISQAIVNAHLDDSLLIKGLKRRLASYSKVVKDEFIKTSFSIDERLEPYLKELSDKSLLSQEEVIRLATEAFVYKL